MHGCVTHGFSLSLGIVITAPPPPENEPKQSSPQPPTGRGGFAFNGNQRRTNGEPLAATRSMQGGFNFSGNSPSTSGERFRFGAVPSQSSSNPGEVVELSSSEEEEPSGSRRSFSGRRLGRGRSYQSNRRPFSCNGSCPKGFHKHRTQAWRCKDKLNGPYHCPYPGCPIATFDFQTRDVLNTHHFNAHG